MQTRNKKEDLSCTHLHFSLVMVVLVDDYERDLVAGAVRPRGQGLPREYDQEYDVSGRNLYQNNTSTYCYNNVMSVLPLPHAQSYKILKFNTSFKHRGDERWRGGLMHILLIKCAECFAT